MAHTYEKRILARADSRFAITEFAADYLARKHGIPVDFLPHTIDLANKAAGFQALSADVRLTIHFCGGIYPAMNQDAVIRLADAAEPGPDSAARQLLFSLLAARTAGARSQARYLPREQLRAAQWQSTVLFLPLAFASDQPAMIQYNFPTKAMEYLCSGRPILVHAPADCYLTWLAKKEGFALVVDHPDSGELAAAIDRLVSDGQLQRELAAKAASLSSIPATLDDGPVFSGRRCAAGIEDDAGQDSTFPAKPSSPAGAERVTVLLANALAERGRPVDVVLVRAEGGFLADLAAQVEVVDLRASRTLFAIPGLAAYMRKATRRGHCGARPREHRRLDRRPVVGHGDASGAGRPHLAPRRPTSAGNSRRADQHVRQVALPPCRSDHLRFRRVWPRT